ncbi:MAG: DUF4476 domain-containing protein [Ferruginibacter sp.]|nr:DUF4476 domain-containing protein [Ferruginibacter sp.]
MMRIAFILTFFFFSGFTQAQEYLFVYIQTENQQPFSVRVNDKLLSSSGSGYLIIPQLTAGNYNLDIGFPKSQWPSQHIPIEVKKDQGYVLKDFGNKGWGLFNFQTMNVVMNENGDTGKTKDSAKKDGFADVLADVVGSPSIKEQKQPDPAPEPVKPVPEKIPVKDTTAPVRSSETKVDSVKIVEKQELPSPAKWVYNPPVKISSVLDNTGRSMIFIDTNYAGRDTIRVFIPYPEEKKEEEKIGKTSPVEPQMEKPVDKPLRDTVSAIPNPPAVGIQKKDSAIVQTSPVKSGMSNSDCKEQADDKDFLKLRKKMAAQHSEENMVVIAMKDFGKRCYTTEQISNLMVLFLTDKGRYSFLDAAYPYVSDSGNFPQLISRLTDEYYINRFKAMIRR